MDYQKIFVIGFNKTATSTFHVLFERNGLSSQHDGAGWNVNEYQCFSDNGDLMDWQRYAADWPDSLFILNLRPLASWMRSRAKHCYTEKLGWGYPPRKGMFKRWIEDRNHHHLALLRHFRDEPQRLIVVDISRKEWLEWIAGEIGLKPARLSVNEAREGIPPSFVYEVDELMRLAFRDLQMDSDEQRAPLLCESQLVDGEAEEARRLLTLYRHNLD